MFSGTDSTPAAHGKDIFMAKLPLEVQGLPGNRGSEAVDMGLGVGGLPMQEELVAGSQACWWHGGAAVTQALGPQLAAEQAPAQLKGDRCALSKKTFPEEAQGPSLAHPTERGTSHIKHPWQGWHNTAESVCSDTGVPKQHRHAATSTGMPSPAV